MLMRETGVSHHLPEDWRGGVGKQPSQRPREHPHPRSGLAHAGARGKEQDAGGRGAACLT